MTLNSKQLTLIVGKTHNRIRLELGFVDFRERMYFDLLILVLFLFKQREKSMVKVLSEVELKNTFSK